MKNWIKTVKAKLSTVKSKFSGVGNWMRGFAPLGAAVILIWSIDAVMDKLGWLQGEWDALIYIGPIFLLVTGHYVYNHTKKD